MDLRNQSITVGELLGDPRSRAVFQRRFGKLLHHPLVGKAHSLTLAQLAERCDPPITKSALNHRLRKLVELGKE